MTEEEEAEFMEGWDNFPVTEYPLEDEEDIFTNGSDHADFEEEDDEDDDIDLEASIFEDSDETAAEGDTAAEEERTESGRKNGEAVPMLDLVVSADDDEEKLDEELLIKLPNCELQSGGELCRWALHNVGIFCQICMYVRLLLSSYL